MIRSTLYFVLLLFFIGTSNAIWSQKASTFNAKRLEKDLPGTWHVIGINLSAFLDALGDEEKEMYETFLASFEEALKNTQIVFFKDKSCFVGDKSNGDDITMMHTWSVSLAKNAVIMKTENATEEMIVQNYNSSDQQLNIMLETNGQEIGIMLVLEKVKDNKNYSVNRLAEEIKSMEKSILGTWVFDETTLLVKSDFLNPFVYYDSVLNQTELVDDEMKRTNDDLPAQSKKQIITLYDNKSYVMRDYYPPYRVRETGEWSATGTNVSLRPKTYNSNSHLISLVNKSNAQLTLKYSYNDDDFVFLNKLKKDLKALPNLQKAKSNNKLSNQNLIDNWHVVQTAKTDLWSSINYDLMYSDADYYDFEENWKELSKMYTFWGDEPLKLIHINGNLQYHLQESNDYIDYDIDQEYLNQLHWNPIKKSFDHNFITANEIQVRVSFENMSADFLRLRIYYDEKEHISYLLERRSNEKNVLDFIYPEFNYNFDGGDEYVHLDYVPIATDHEILQSWKLDQIVSTHAEIKDDKGLFIDLTTGQIWEEGDTITLLQNGALLVNTPFDYQSLKKWAFEEDNENIFRYERVEQNIILDLNIEELSETKLVLSFENDFENYQYTFSKISHPIFNRSNAESKALVGCWQRDSIKHSSYLEEMLKEYGSESSYDEEQLEIDGEESDFDFDESNYLEMKCFRADGSYESTYGFEGSEGRIELGEEWSGDLQVLPTSIWFYDASSKFIFAVDRYDITKYRVVELNSNNLIIKDYYPDDEEDTYSSTYYYSLKK